MDDQSIEKVWDEIVDQAAREKDIELEAAVLGLALTIASAKFADPETRELLVRGAACVFRHTDRFKAGGEPQIH